ncbi:MAG: hypothetical protein H7647_04535 [Candidatus Heimdallarchaeota archaeon]|nr:hypothetical protein [Candidatus Heimdallarchaeota archaeon]MCK4253692.1 hypothetical protein [Candidatus Heimdallarchaeota archaeon]
MHILQNKLNLAKSHLVRGEYREFQDTINIIERNCKSSIVQRLESSILQMLFTDKTDNFGPRDELILKASKLLKEICLTYKLEIIRIMDKNSRVSESLIESTIIQFSNQSRESQHKFLIVSMAKIKFQYKYNILFSLFSHYIEVIMRIAKSMNEDYYYIELLNELCWSFTYRGCFDNALKSAEKLLSLARELESQELVMRSLAYLRYNYGEKGFHDLSLKHGYQYLELAKNAKSKYRIWHAHISLSFAYCYSGDLLNSMKFLNLAREHEKDLNYKRYKGWEMLIRGQISYYEGHLHKAYEQLEDVIKFFQNSKQYYPLGFGYNMMGSISYQLGDHDDAIELYMKSLKFIEKHDNGVRVALTYLKLISIYAIQRDKVNLRKCLTELDKLKKISSDRIVDTINEAGKAINLRYESDKIKQSKEIFEKIIMNKSMLFATMEKSYLYICDILFEEVKRSKDINLLIELNRYIRNFIDFAEKNQAHLLLIELYFLQSKLATLEFKTDTSLSLLERAQEVANQKGLNRLEIYLSNEHDALLEQLDTWERVSNYLPTLEERFEATHIEEVLSKMLLNRVNYTEVSIEVEKPVSFVIFDENYSVLFADSLSETLTEENEYVDLFARISEKRSFFEHNDKILKIKYREFMCIISKEQDVLLCYIFIGKSFFAMRKFMKLVDAFSNNDIISSVNGSIPQNKHFNLDERMLLSSIIRKEMC